MTIVARIDFAANEIARCCEMHRIYSYNFLNIIFKDFYKYSNTSISYILCKVQLMKI